MNLAIRGIDGQIAHGDTFHDDRHPDLKADFNLTPIFRSSRLDLDMHYNPPSISWLK